MGKGGHSGRIGGKKESAQGGEEKGKAEVGLAGPLP